MEQVVQRGPRLSATRRELPLKFGHERRAAAVLQSGEGVARPGRRILRRDDPRRVPDVFADDTGSNSDGVALAPLRKS